MRILLFLLVLAVLLVGSPRALGQGCGTATHSCLEVDLRQPGCNDSVCCNTVCSLEPSCCDIAWDDLCVALALKFCQTCGVAGNSCFAVAAAPGCASPNCCNFVCSLPGFESCCTIAWDANCVAAALFYCQGCGAPGADNCGVVHNGTGCKDGQCCAQVCAVDPNCCTQSWDQTCVDWAQQFCPGCGSPFVGACCYPHLGPFCDNADCCNAVCAIDDYCCTVSWDANCVLIANATCDLPNCLCGDPTAGLCKTVHATPGCDDFECCTQVCFIDAYCCAVSWDYACTKATEQVCDQLDACGDIGKGSCVVKHPTPGCDDGACCQRVCNIDPLCCEIQWDDDCVVYANIVCTDCGDTFAGSCYEAHGSPACSDAACCTGVCNGDPFCCQEEWDTVCAFFAVSICPAPITNCGSATGRSCYVPSYLPGCDDASCCAEICLSVDPFCCEVRWDAVCVDLTLTYCGGFGPCPGRGSCIFEHPFPGCNDTICCSAVCQIDNVCCSLGWDVSCADIARAICFGLQDCPGDKRCDQSHGSPGCEDASCCNVVCSVDPVCCIEKWDNLCVQVAQVRCQPDPNSNCPCLGSCLESHPNPGCDDASCCAGVCQIDSYCCEIVWDQLCVGLARGVCCGDIGCGNSCSGSCYIPHNQPYCSSPSCCETVCTVDPFCCDTKWDGSCVAVAVLRCAHLCGVPGAGSCFSEKDTPACANRACCDKVCNADPLCCDAAWDATCVVLAKGDPLANPPKLGLCTPPACGDTQSGPCCSAHATPACDDFVCCTAVCQGDPFCCDTEWDEACAGSARQKPECNCVSECGDACAGSCCFPHSTPLCDDEACCTAVCAVDPFCCSLAGGAWDTVCVGIVYMTPGCFIACPPPECGDADAGDCCIAHFFPNCSDESCCDAVCVIDNYCCNTQWDFACAVLAGKVCSECQFRLFCGAPATGSCFVAHQDPFCNDPGCCNLVCTFDETCCSDSWDVTCADFAAQFCVGQ